MVDASGLSSAEGKGQVGIIVGGASTVRGNRFEIAGDDTYVVYATKDNLNFRHNTDPHTKSVVYTSNRVDITAVAKRPGHDNQYAFGDAQGRGGVLEITENGGMVKQITDIGFIGGQVSKDQ